MQALTWEETDALLEQLKREIFDFYELHTPKDVREDPVLQAELRAIQVRCHAVHYRRIDLNILALEASRARRR